MSAPAESTAMEFTAKEYSLHFHNMAALFHETVSYFKDATATQFFRGGVWQTQTWRELGTRALHLAQGLKQLGAKKGDRIGILASGSPEWMLVDCAAATLGCVTVPVYLTLDEETTRFVLKDADVKILFVDPGMIGDKVIMLRDYFGDRRRKTYLIDIASFELDSSSAEPTTIADVEAIGANTPDRKALFEGMLNIDPDDPYTFIYTSGTTGTPKGVILTHRNFVSNIEASLRRIPVGLGTETYLSYLPLAHSFERHCHYLMLSRGSIMCYGRGFDSLASDLNDVHPTLMIGVPRVFEKFYDRVVAAVQEKGAVSRALFHWSIKQGTKRFYEKRATWKSKLADKLVLEKIPARLGGRMKFMVSGGGPLNPAHAEFFNGAGLCVIEGYGLTESSPVIAVNPLDNIRIGTVGPVYDNLDAKLTERGELIIKGPSISPGYHNRPEETAETFKDGWLYTGDQAEFDEAGYLKITGRFKELIVCSNGKKVVPRRLEDMLKALGWVEQVSLVGDNRAFMTALLVPSLEGLNERVATEGLQFETLEEAVLREKVWELVERDIANLNQKLAKYEMIRRWALVPDPFSEENGLMTPTQKVKNYAVHERYKEVIESLYGKQAKVVDNRVPLLPNPFHSAKVVTDEPETD